MRETVRGTMRNSRSIAAQRSLFPELPAPSPGESSRATKPLDGPQNWKRLWLCTYLPGLPLEALDDDGTPIARAVFEEDHGIRKVLLANRQARAAGIVPGQSANAALALEPGLQLEQRDLKKEQRVLEGLAGWGEKFTSFVSVEAPDILLLEIGGSLRLFGGLDDLHQRIERGFAQQGFHACMTIAPTPLAATWLARARRPVWIRSEHKLTGALGSLPLACLGWSTAVTESLNGMGVSSIGDCLRLPRQGFAKRFGACRLLELDRALGRLPDPRASYRTAERFCAEYDLCEEQSDRELILNACRELLLELERFLLARQLAVQGIRLSFFHLKGAATSLTLGCVQPDRTMAHWFELLGIRFDRLVLPAPVIAIRLRSGQSQPLCVATEGLRFTKTDGEHRGSPMAHLVERLSARLGSELVHGVMTVAEHRPHYAWRPQGPLQGILPAPETVNAWYDERLRRPLWMLPEPRPLAIDSNRPLYEGELTLTNGPERLETGWWDGDGISRDYFVAVNSKGVRLWIYRNRAADHSGNPNGNSRWYLHGIFG